MSASLCIIAHCDDEGFLGAVIARLCAEGQRVVVMPLADGETSRRDVPEGAIQRRIDMAAKCADVLGHELRVPHHDGELMWPDQRLDVVPGLDLTRVIESAIADLHPATVYTHSPHDLNADHRRVYEVVLPAVRPKSGVTAVYSFAGPRMLQFNPTSFVAVTEAQLERQRAALACYGDELSGGEWELIKARAVECGYRVGVPYAEGFETIRCLL